MNEAEREICRRRGHVATNGGFTAMWRQCRWCGVWVRRVMTTEERIEAPPPEEQDPITRLESRYGDRIKDE